MADRGGVPVPDGWRAVRLRDVLVLDQPGANGGTIQHPTIPECGFSERLTLRAMGESSQRGRLGVASLSATASGD